MEKGKDNREMKEQRYRDEERGRAEKRGWERMKDKKSGMRYKLRNKERQNVKELDGKNKEK